MSLLDPAASLAALPGASPQRIAVFRALQLGDMLCAVPALRALRQRFPEAHITLIGLPWAAQFARRFKAYLDDFIAFPGHPALPEQPVQDDLLPGFHTAVRARRFDLAVQLHGSGEVSNRVVQAFGAARMVGCGEPCTARDGDLLVPYPSHGHEAERLMAVVRLLGAPHDDLTLEFPLTPDDEAELQASGLAAGLSPSGYFCVHPGARWRDKCWSPACFAQVADRLAQATGLNVVLTGSAKEADLTAAVAAHMRSPARDTASPLSIGAMAALMARARLLLCNDTGVSHIASGLGLPSVVVFSKADMQRWAPLNNTRHRALWDPAGAQVDAVVQAAMALLPAHARVSAA